MDEQLRRRIGRLSVDRKIFDRVHAFNCGTILVEDLLKERM